MNRNKTTRSLFIIGIGLVVLVVTYFGFSALYNSTAPSEADINDVAASGTRQDVLELVERSDQAKTVRTLSMIVIGIELVVITVFLVQELKR
jgi:hypothetical protein